MIDIDDDDSGKIKEADKETIKRYLRMDYDTNKIDLIHTDINNDREYINSNNESFKKLLNTYVDNANRNLVTKLIFKTIFFIACIAILIGIFVLLCKITWFCLNNEVSTETLIITMVNTVVSFLSSFIVLPHTIAQYLYNNEEEKNMTEVVKNIQERDKIIRENMRYKDWQI